MRENQSLADEYINQLFAIEDETLLAIRSALKADKKEGINIGPYEGKILQFLIKALHIEKIVEIGTLYGYSALWMARALPEQGKLYCLESEPNHFEKAQHFLMKSEVQQKIEIHLGDALSSLQQLSAKAPFDMVFIDANKAGYIKYLDWAEEHIKSGGLIVGDNTFLFGNVFADNSQAHMTINKETIAIMREFNSRLANPKKYNSILLPTAEGMTVAQKL
ncbi:MAG: O-methyltransferase [Bdellovibrionales bacterium]|nr:O-methyltransferase [Bdellovibrionales bacterium]